MISLGFTITIKDCKLSSQSLSALIRILVAESFSLSKNGLNKLSSNIKAFKISI